jgi:hypothetical protein
LSRALSQAASHSAFVAQSAGSNFIPNVANVAQRVSRKICPKDEPADTAEDICWVVPFQPRIECWATNEDEIEIEQISPIHEDENIRIDVARSNAVRLARCILWAAGFNSVLIATSDGGGGYRDVEDGDLPEHFAGRP